LGHPTNAVTQAVGGSKMHVKVQETVYHPGFFFLSRRAGGELGDRASAVRKRRPNRPIADRDSLTGEVMKPGQMPVLADGLFMHHEKAAAALKPTSRADISCKR